MRNNRNRTYFKVATQFFGFIRLRNAALVFVGLCLFTSPVLAQGAYASLKGAYTIQNDVDVSEPLGLLNTEVGFEDGWAIWGALGYDFDPIRAEIEAGYGRNDADTVTFTLIGIGLPPLDADGKISVFTAMLNGYYDIPTDSPWTPYIGAGVGLSRVNADISTLGVPLVDDNDTVFAVQAMAGVEYAVSPTVSILGEYRFSATADIDLVDPLGVDLSADGLRTHSIGAGVRVKF